MEAGAEVGTAPLQTLAADLSGDASPQQFMDSINAGNRQLPRLPALGKWTANRHPCDTGIAGSPSAHSGPVWISYKAPRAVVNSGADMDAELNYQRNYPGRLTQPVTAVTEPRPPVMAGSPAVETKPQSALTRAKHALIQPVTGSSVRR